MTEVDDRKMVFDEFYLERRAVDAAKLDLLAYSLEQASQRVRDFVAEHGLVMARQLDIELKYLKPDSTKPGGFPALVTTKDDPDWTTLDARVWCLVREA